MKKVFALMSIVAMFSMVACGPSNKEAEEAEKKRIQDSTNAADSAAAAQKAMEESMAAPQDTAVVDSMAAPAEETHEAH